MIQTHFFSVVSENELHILDLLLATCYLNRHLLPVIFKVNSCELHIMIHRWMFCAKLILTSCSIISLVDLHQNLSKAHQQRQDTQQHDQHQSSALWLPTQSLPASVRITAGPRKHPYACSVLMFFANDARKFALQVGNCSETVFIV